MPHAAAACSLLGCPGAGPCASFSRTQILISDAFKTTAFKVQNIRHIRFSNGWDACGVVIITPPPHHHNPEQSSGSAMLAVCSSHGAAIGFDARFQALAQMLSTVIQIGQLAITTGRIVASRTQDKQQECSYPHSHCLNGSPDPSVPQLIKNLNDQAARIGQLAITTGRIVGVTDAGQAARIYIDPRLVPQRQQVPNRCSIGTVPIPPHRPPSLLRQILRRYTRYPELRKARTSEEGSSYNLATQPLFPGRTGNHYLQSRITLLSRTNRFKSLLALGQSS